MVLVDTNVLIYAADERAPQHRTTRRWLEAAMTGDETIGFAWTVALGFLRLATRPGLSSRPLSVAEATDTLETWLAQSAASIVEPTAGHFVLLRALLEQVGTAANLVNDAHLAALSLEHDASVCSFDSDFARFKGVRWFRPGS